MTDHVTDEARSLLKESFAEDMAEHQRLHGQLPTPEENRKIAVPEFEKLEQQIEDERLRFRPKTETRERDSRSVSEKAASKGYRFFREEEKPDEKLIVPALSFNDVRARERIAMLVRKRERGPLGQPSWRDRVKAMVIRYKHDEALGVPYLYNRGRRLLEEVLEESSKVFGDWRKPPEDGRRLYKI